MSKIVQTLKWGDIVRIHGVNLSRRDEQNTKGLIVSKGFTDSNIYYQKYRDFKDVNFYRESLFQICPRSNFDMHDQLEKDNLTPQIKEQLKARAISEVKGLENSLKAKAGTNILYGSDAIFKHVSSQSYLRGILKAAEFGEGAFKIQVTESLSSQLIFKITSHRSYERECDQIYYDDALLIYHPGSDCFMNFAENDEPMHLSVQSPDQIPPDHEFHEFSKNRPSIKKQKFKRIPIINENKSKCLWKFIEHCTYEESNSKKKIKSHDIVYFEHTKEGGLVSTSLAQPVRYFLKESNRGLFYECLWELIPKKVNELGPEQCNSFCARNIVTGELLNYNGFDIEVQSENEGEATGFDNEGLINLICTDPGHESACMLERDTEIQQREELPKIVEYYENSFKKISFKKVSKMPKDIFKIYKIDERALLDIEYALSSHEPLVKLIQLLSSGLAEQHKQGFRYEEFFEELREDPLNNIICILKMLIGKIYQTKYEEIALSGNLPDFNMQKILVEAGIIQLVIEIIYLLYTPFKLSEGGFKDESDQCLKIRLRLGDIFEFCYRLLEKTAANNQENRVYISRWVDLFRLHSININRSYIQECLVGILKNNPISIEGTITEDKINELIYSFFEEAKHETPNSFLTTKYLRLFSTFIVCEDRVLRENQNIILNKFFKNPANELSFRFKVEFKPESEDEASDLLGKIRSREVLIAFGKQEFTTISKFFRDWTSKWNYFIAYVNLLADICMQRNSEAINNVSALLSLQIVTTILFDPLMDKLNEEIEEENQQGLEEKRELKFPAANVHEPFIRIAHHLYIDNNKFAPVKRIKKISRWHAHEGEEGPVYEEINRTKRIFEGEREEEEGKYLKCILLFIKNFLDKCDQDSHKLPMLYTVLDVLKTTVKLGLWNSFEEFRELIPLLMMRITKIEGGKFYEADRETRERKTIEEIVKMNKEYLKMNRPEITTSIDCKIKATAIFREMNEYEIDIRLRYLMNFFKGLYQTTEDFNLYDFVEGRQAIHGASQSDEERDRIARQQYNAIDSNSILGDINRISEDEQVILKNNVWYNKLVEMTPFRYERSAAKNPMKNRYQFHGRGIFALTNLILLEDEDRLVNREFDSLVLSLLELPAYKNYQLFNAAIRTLRAIFEQRADLISNFKKILICAKGNLEQLYFKLKFMRGKFDTLNDPSILKYSGDDDPNFSYALSKPYDYLEKSEEKKSGIIQDLWFLSKTLIENISLKNIESLMSVDERAFNKTEVYNCIDERQKTNPLFQAVNMAEGIYKPLIEYIRIVGDNEFSGVHYKLLKSIYQYLTLLCYHNLEAKQSMMSEIPLILPHLSRKVGAAKFLFIVCENNKLLVSNKYLVIKIIDAALSACIELDNSLRKQSLIKYGSCPLNLEDYEKSCIFYALRGILTINDEGYRRNQELLMNRLQDNKFRSLIFKDTLIEYNSKLSDFNLSPTEAYITAHFEMFASLVESNNMINIGKLENIHSYQYCLECMRKSNRWQIRRALRKYVNRLYYVNKDRDIFLFEEFIRKEFDIINHEIHDLVELHRSGLLTIDVRICNGIRFQFAVSEIMLFIIEILISLHEIMLKSEFMKVLRREVRKEEKYAETSRPLHDKTVRLYKHLGCLHKLYPENKLIASFLREVSNLVKNILLGFQVRYLQKKAEPEIEGKKQETDEIGGKTVEKKAFLYDHSKSFFRNLSDMIRDLKAKEKAEALRHEFEFRKTSCGSNDAETKHRCIDTIYSVPNEKLKPVFKRKRRNQQAYINASVETTTSQTFKVLAKRQLTENEQNIEFNTRLRMVKQMMDESPVFRKFKDDEFINFVSILSHINQTSAKFYSENWKKYDSVPTAVISMKEIFTLSFDMIIHEPTGIADQEKIFIIKSVRCYITEAVEQNQHYKLPIDKWDANYFDKKDLFQERQELLSSCGCSDLIISVLSEDLTGRFELLNEILLLGIAYLFGGNEVCQNSIKESLMGDRDNCMLLNLRRTIKRIGEFLTEIRSIREEDRSRGFAYNIVDSYNYFSVAEYALVKELNLASTDKFEEMTESANEQAMCRIFRLLQLFCESNNIKFKKFLETQVNEDGSKKTNSVNFIEEACLLLRKFFKIMNAKMVRIPKYLLDFLVEITQLPCLDNQLSLMRSTFCEDISYMATFFNNPNHRSQRKFNKDPEADNDPLNELFNIYEQAVQLVLSNFEGNNDVLYQQFLNKCKPQFLWVIVSHNLFTLIKEKYSHWEEFQAPLQQGESKERCFDSKQSVMRRLDSQLTLKLIRSEKKKGENFDGRLITILNVFVIFRKIEDYACNKEDEGHPEARKAREFRHSFIRTAKEEFPNFKDVVEIMEGLLLQIEVSTFNGREQTLQKVYFPNQPVFDYLSNSTKDNIMMEVERTTRRDKLISLTSFKDSIFSELKWGYELNYNVFKVLGVEYEQPITSQICERVRKAARNCSFLICFLFVVLITVDHNEEDQSSHFIFTQNFFKLVVEGLCCIQLGITLLYCYLWGKMRAKLALLKYYEEPELNSQKIQIEEYEEAEQAKSTEGWVTMSEQAAALGAKVSSMLSVVKGFVQENYIYKNLIEPVLAIQKSESGFLSLTLFVVTSLLGNFYGVEWFTIHLFDMFVEIPLLTNVFKAIINNIKTLTILSMLAAAFILVFNVLSLSTYTPVIYGEDIPEQNCEDILQCVLDVYTSGAIGDDMDSLIWDRFIFDIIYVTFMEMLFGNLVSGIMLDAFAELKSEDKDRDDDKKGKCYICSMSLQDIEKSADRSFRNHISKHFIWHYMFYIYCLGVKNETDYTGIEYTIKKQLESEEVDWFPDLGHSGTEEEVEDKLRGLKAKAEEVRDKVIRSCQSTTSKVDQGVKIFKVEAICQ